MSQGYISARIKDKGIETFVLAVGQHTTYVYYRWVIRVRIVPEQAQWQPIFECAQNLHAIIWQPIFTCTLCFSGGWALTPPYQNRRQKLHLPSE